MREVKVGDVVQLKSGGPTMTVDSVTYTGAYRCVWFGVDHKLREEYIRPEALEVREHG